MSKLTKHVLAAVLAVSACSSPPATRVGNDISVTASSPIEAKLAALEKGQQGPAQTVTVASVRDFDQALQALERFCQQSREELADMTTVAVQQLRKQRRPVGYLEMLRGVEQLLTAAKAPPGKATDCRVVFASALTVLEK